jgi:hypothetical protein
MLYQWPDGSIHTAPPPTKEELALFSILMAHRTLFAEGKIEFQVIDPTPPFHLPSFVEFTQEIPIEEANKRWPDTPIKED